CAREVGYTNYDYW
nr:immunoglobulin heavy chain junction region [Macaca mulatta]MOW88851.1 immunoglobulin heavy chain junction region [Macaca mulatta]MOW89148.1 immunoglobulin heavy chain junction region [Macaca mulatta]MOW90788.1 immunoglobulin heavy chain junction region [Macaca mulatta]MOW91037.1 immunoglobulin heavy chain junction region [Macaca mulatta]